MIWDPIKQFACLCKGRFRGELCEKGVPDMNVLFIMYKTLKNVVRMHQCNCFPNDQILTRSRRCISVPWNVIQTIDEISPLKFHFPLFELHSKCHV